MEKKWFAALLMVAVLVCACWTGAVAEDEERETFTVGDYEYALLDDGTVEITGYSGDAQTFTIKDPPHNCAQTIHIIPATQISRKSAIQAHYLHTK